MRYGIVAIVLIVFVFSLSVVSADTLTITFDFPADVNTVTGTVSGGAHLSAESWIGGTYPWRDRAEFYVYGLACPITEVSIDNWTDNPLGGIVIYVYVKDAVGNNLETSVYNSGTQTPSVWRTHTVAFNADPLATTLWVRAEHVLSIQTGAIRLDNLDITCDGEIGGGGSGTPLDLTRPLAEEDEHPFYEMYDFEYVQSLDPSITYDNRTVWAFSDGLGAPVYSAAAGTVLSVRKQTAADCDSNAPDIIDGAMQAAIGNANCFITIPKPIANETFDLIYRTNLANSYIVDITYEDDPLTIFRYVVNNAPEYISPGWVINAGCILGEVVPLLNLTAIELESVSVSSLAGQGDFGLSFGLRSLNTEIGVVTMAAANLELPEFDFLYHIYPGLVNYAQFDDACNKNTDYADCLGDATLSHQNQWTSTGSVAWGTGVALGLDGVRLSPGAAISAQFNLDGTQTYSMTVVAKVIGATEDSEINLRLGQTTVNSTVIASAGDRMHVISPHFPIPDAGSFYTVSVQNTGREIIEVTSICVTSTTNNPGLSACYFDNHSFEYGASSWTLSTGVEWGQGSIDVPWNETLSTNINISPPVGGGVYTLRVTAVLLKNAFFSYENYTPLINPQPTVNLQYEMPFGSGFTSITAPGGVDVDYWEWNLQNDTMVFEQEIVVANPINGTFTLKPIVDDASDTNVSGLKILDVCLSGYTPPGQGAVGPPNPFNPKCSPIAPPNGNSIGDWTYWHFSNLDQFFQCDLMVLLNRIYKTMIEAYETFGWSIRYSQSAWINVVNWLGDDLFPWLEGHFNNMARGSVITINSSEQCGNIFCAFTILVEQIGQAIQSSFDTFNLIITELLSPIIDGLLPLMFSAIALLINIISQIINVGFGLLNMFLGVIANLITYTGIIFGAWNNSVPLAIPGLPLCGVDPQGDALCITLWMMENTIFSGIGALIIPLIIGFGSIMLILWGFGELRGAVTEANEAI